MIRRLWITALATAVLLAGAGSVAPTASGADTPAAATVLSSLPVKGRAPMTGYARSQFGQAWADVDRNGCDTRTDILKRDLVERQMANRCKVLSGVLYPDPYTGRPLTYVRGRSVVDVDHVVALGNAWATGAQQLTGDDRLALANDPFNLLAVQASANRQKGDGDAATWLPSNKRYRCAYVARQVAVKAKYRLWVTPAEKAAIARVLGTCPGQRVPRDGTLPDPAPPASGGGSTTAGSATGSTSTALVSYPNCDAARAAGAAPIRKAATPELYALNDSLDRDKDGVACE